MKMIYDTLFGKYKYIHFLLDFNFYAYGKWMPYLVKLQYGGPCQEKFEMPGTDVDEEGTPLFSRKEKDNYICEEYHRALRGEEYWIDENTGELRTLTPMGPADHVIAGMEGVNYFYYNVLYRPAVGKYLLIDGKDSDPDIEDKLEEEQSGYYQSEGNYIDGYADLMGGAIEVTPLYGRFQKDRWDIQDNENIYYDKVLRRGYAEEKMVAIFAIGNTGWFDAKYRRESRSNSIDQQFEGLENVKFTMLSDVVDEEALFSFSPYCYSIKTKAVVKVDAPINLLTNWAVNPPFPGCKTDENGNYIMVEVPLANGKTAQDCLEEDYTYAPKKNLCSQLGDEYIPVHAGWTYFDKMWPMYWTMGNVANISADTSVLQRFVSYRINTYDIDNYPEPDVNEVQFLNKDGNAYYRAVLAMSVLDIQDQFGLTRWKECNNPYDTADDDLCMKGVTFTKDGADAANAELGVMWLYKDKCVLIKDENTESDLCVDKDEDGASKTNKDNGVKWVSKKTDCVLIEDNETIADQCFSEGDERFPKSAKSSDPSPREQFTEYLAEKYSRLSPSFRLVRSAGKLKQSESDSIEEGAEGWSRLVIMETTIDQLNSFAADNLGTATFYVSHY